MGFSWKNFILTTTSGHHWRISLPDHQQNQLLLPFSHLDLLLSHYHLPSYPFGYTFQCPRLRFTPFFFFFWHVFQEQTCLLRLMFMHCSWTVAATFDYSPVNSVPVHCLWVPQTSLFSNFFIKNGSHNTIHKFKNYFTTVFSVFNFQFQQNKFYPNEPSSAPLIFFLNTVHRLWMLA